MAENQCLYTDVILGFGSSNQTIAKYGFYQDHKGSDLYILKNRRPGPRPGCCNIHLMTKYLRLLNGSTKATIWLAN